MCFGLTGPSPPLMSEAVCMCVCLGKKGVTGVLTVWDCMDSPGCGCPRNLGRARGWGPTGQGVTPPQLWCRKPQLDPPRGGPRGCGSSHPCSLALGAFSDVVTGHCPGGSEQSLEALQVPSGLLAPSAKIWVEKEGRGLGCPVSQAQHIPLGGSRWGGVLEAS